MALVDAFTLEDAARVTKTSVRRIAYWDKKRVLSPSVRRGESGSPHSRIYSFRDLVGLKTIARLRDMGLSLQSLREFTAWLTEHSETPWSSLRFYVIQTEKRPLLAFRDPLSGQILSTRPRQQSIMEFDLMPVAVETRRDAEALKVRGADEFGKITRSRGVLGNKPVIAGTRIPTLAIWESREAGWSDKEILLQYPRLTPIDIEAAYAAEQERRQQHAS